jgi:hypothetical protein
MWIDYPLPGEARQTCTQLLTLLRHVHQSVR